MSTFGVCLFKCSLGPYSKSMALFNSFINFILWVWVFCLHVCVCILCSPSPWRSETVLDPPGLELQMDVGNRDQALWHNMCSYPQRCLQPLMSLSTCHIYYVFLLPNAFFFLFFLFLSYFLSLFYLFSPFFKLVKVIWNTFFTVEDSKTNLYGKDVEFPSCVLQVSPLKTTVTCEDLWELKLQSHKHVYTSM